MTFPLLGCGIGLRAPHFASILGGRRVLDWFEAISENFMDTGGRPVRILEKIRENYPVGLHGVALSIGSVDPLHLPYLEKLKALADRIDPAIVSDHICWAGVGGEHLHDLLPLPFTEESLRVIVEKTDQVQNFLGRRILLENASTYVTFKHSTMTEWEFVREVARRSGCGLLLDINNVYVNAFNHGFDAREYIRNIPGELVGQIHLAGHTDKGSYLFDTHSSPVIDEVWKLYEEALALWGKKTTLIEWDEDIPEFSRLVEECEKARKIYQIDTRKQRPVTRMNKTKSMIPLVSGNRFLPPQKRTDPPVVLAEVSHSAAPALNEIQLWMRSEIEPSLRDGSQHPVSSEKVTGEPSLILNPQSGDPGIERLEIYCEGYLARTEESLKEVYEAVRHVIGPAAFHDLAHAYAESFPSPNYNLNIKGEKLPEFLKQFGMGDQPLIQQIQSLPFLSDLALLEWKISEAFHSFDFPVLDPESLSKMNPEDWDHLQIDFQPSVFLMQSSWPVLDVWQARKTPLKDIKINMENRPQTILIARRPNQEVVCRLLEGGEYQMLFALRSGKKLGDALDIFADVEAEIPLSAWFASWTRDGLIANCSLAPSLAKKNPTHFMTQNQAGLLPGNSSED